MNADYHSNDLLIGYFGRLMKGAQSIYSINVETYLRCLLDAPMKETF